MLEPVFEDVGEFRCEDLYLLTVGTEAGKEIWTTCHEIAHMLVKKNIAYGNSALLIGYLVLLKIAKSQS